MSRLDAIRKNIGDMSVEELRDHIRHIRSDRRITKERRVEKKKKAKSSDGAKARVRKMGVAGKVSDADLLAMLEEMEGGPEGSQPTGSEDTTGPG